MTNSVEPATAAEVLLQPAPRAVQPGRPARMLMAFTAGRTSAPAVQEAHAFAQRLGAELHLIRVVAPVGADGSCAPRDLVRALRESQRVLAAGRHTRKVCNRVLAERLPGPRICVRLGTLVDQVAQRAVELDAQIIAVPRGMRRLAPSVIDLARRTDRAILVPKGWAGTGTLIAATDLEDWRTPVLRKAAELGRELRASVVAVHGIVDVAGSGRDRIEQTRQQLEHATHGFVDRLETIFLQTRDPVDGILQEARAHGASLIIVGARSQRQRTAPSTAARLLMRARRSILVEPLGMPTPWPLATS